MKWHWWHCNVLPSVVISILPVLARLPPHSNTQQLQGPPYTQACTQILLHKCTAVFTISEHVSYLAVVAPPHLQFLHRADVVELDESVHRPRGQPVAVGVPQYAVDLLLVRVDRAEIAWNSNLVQRVKYTQHSVGMQQHGPRPWKTASKNTLIAASPVVHVGIWQ
jgi:hypothetical protein